MLDLHCHILPGVDDGAASLDVSLAMARFCLHDGITHVVATPHCHRHCRLLRTDILPHVTNSTVSLTPSLVPQWWQEVTRAMVIEPRLLCTAHPACVAA